METIGVSGGAAAKRRGSRFEVSVVQYLRDHGFQAHRTLAGATVDRGDIAGVPDVTFELKAYSNVTRAVADGLRDLEVEQANADTPYGAVIAKRPRVTDPGRQLAVMELWQLVALLKKAGVA